MSPIIYHLFLLKKKNCTISLSARLDSALRVYVLKITFHSFFFFFVPAALFDQVNREQYTDALFIVTINSTFQPLFH